MLRKTRMGILVLVTAALPTAVADAADTYVYTRGKNYVDTGGARCVVGDPSQQADVSRFGNAQAYVNYLASGSRTLLCPINRRSLHYYGLSSGAGTTAVSTVRETVRVYDGNSTASLSCKPFAKSIGGSVWYGATKYACSTFQGCSADPGGSFMGYQVLNLASIAQTSTVNWGISCSVPPSGEIHWYEGVVTPNAN